MNIRKIATFSLWAHPPVDFYNKIEKRWLSPVSTKECNKAAFSVKDYHKGNVSGIRAHAKNRPPSNKNLSRSTGSSTMRHVQILKNSICAILRGQMVLIIRIRWRILSGKTKHKETQHCLNKRYPYRSTTFANGYIISTYLKISIIKFTYKESTQ